MNDQLLKRERSMYEMAPSTVVTYHNRFGTLLELRINVGYFILKLHHSPWDQHQATSFVLGCHRSLWQTIIKPDAAFEMHLRL